MKKQYPEKKKIIDRLSRIEGQVRGIKKMIEDGGKCEKIITQVSAVREAVSMLGTEILKGEISGCLKKGKRVDENMIKNVFKFK